MNKENLYTDDASQELSRLQEPEIAYEAQTDSIDTFEEDWEKALSGDEFVRRVHEHIDKWYAKE